MSDGKQDMNTYILDGPQRPVGLDDLLAFGHHGRSIGSVSFFLLFLYSFSRLDLWNARCQVGMGEKMRSQVEN